MGVKIILLTNLLGYVLAFKKESTVNKEQVNDILQLGSLFVQPFPLWPWPAAWRGPRGRS